MKYCIFLIIFLLATSSCKNSVVGSAVQGVANNTPATQVGDEPAGSNCEYGGKKVLTGNDINNSGSLESNEVVSVNFACNQQGTFNYLSLDSSEPAGANCEYAGRVVKGGLDLNADGVLDQEEVQDVKYVCNPKPEPEYKALVKIVAEPVGDNCALGGVSILSGLDTNIDGELTPDEVTETIYKCNTEADFEALVNVLKLDFGSIECPLGGTKVVQGLDINKNGSLDQNEIKQSATALNCLKAEDFAELSRVETLAFGSAECALGGTKTLTGRDLNSNGSLEDSEITSTTLSCKSNSDFSSLVVMKDLPLKDANCRLGGKETITGFDYNGNGVLDETEINKEATVRSCYTEADYNKIVIESAEPMGATCIYGGTKIEKGLDYNRDGLLNPDEIDPSLTSYNCLGAKDFNTLIVVTDEPFGSANCALGGKKTDTGLDLNKDGVLGVDEIEQTTFACYLPDHFNLLSRTTEEPTGSNCTLGGKKVESGRDYNSNGLLDEDELDATLTVYNCYPPEAFNLVAKSYAEPKGNNCRLGGVKTEMGRDINANGVLDVKEVDPALTNYKCTQSFAKSKITLGSVSVVPGGTVLVTLSLIDELGIPINRSGMNVEFLSSGGTSVGEFSPVVDNVDGTYSSIFTGLTAGTPLSISAIVEGEEVTTAKPSIAVEAIVEYGYLNFNGSTGYVEVADSPSLNFTGSFTVSAWVKWNIDPGTGQLWSNIVGKGLADTGWKIQHSQNNASFEFAIKSTGSSGKWIWSTTQPKQGVWYCITGVYDQAQSKMFLYVDGKLESQASASGTLISVPQPVSIGRNGFASRYFNGSIDEVAILNKAASAAEVLALYNNGITAVDASNVISYWAFYSVYDAGSGVTKTADKVGPNNGTLKGGVEFIKR